MRFLKVLFWLLLGGLAAAFVIYNSDETVSIRLWGGLIADFSLPLLLILVFLLGLLPSLVDAMGRVKGWTGNGLHVPQQVGSKVTSNCGSVLQLDGGKWRQVSGGGFACGPLLNGN